MSAPSPRQLTLLLLLITLASLAPRLYVAIHQYIEYDGWWHVLIARQDNWDAFDWDYLHNAHPPLFYLLLKVACSFGSNRIAYRAVSLLAGVGSVWMSAAIVRRMSRHWLTPVLAATIFGFSILPVVISNEVRSYMLATFFLLVAFRGFIDLLPGGNPSTRARVLFAAGMCGALASHYSSVLFLGACGVYFVYADLAARGNKLFTRANLLTVLPVAVFYGALYYTHQRNILTLISHLPSFYRDANSTESAEAFLLRNGQAEIDLFSPLYLVPDFFPLALLLLALVAGVGFYWLHIRRQSRDLVAGAPLAMLTMILSAIAILAVLGRFPFGGGPRHQFILFPFLVLSLCTLLDRLPGRRVLLSLALVLAVLNATWQLKRFHILPVELGALQVASLQRAFPDMQNLYTDQYDVISVFANYDKWRWHMQEYVPQNPFIEEYDLDQGPRRIKVFRDRSRWQVNWGQDAFYADLAACQQVAGGKIHVFFQVQGGEPVAPTPAAQEAFRRKVADLAANHKLRLNKVVVSGPLVFAEFEGRG